jgi:hypothetical protein
MLTREMLLNPARKLVQRLFEESRGELPCDSEAVVNVWKSCSSKPNTCEAAADHSDRRRQGAQGTPGARRERRPPEPNSPALT